MTTNQPFPWESIAAALEGVSDDDIRHDALLIAHAAWERRTAVGKPCDVRWTAYNAYLSARKRAARNRRISLDSTAIECAPARLQDRPTRLAADWHALTPRQGRIAAALADGRNRAAIAETEGVHPAQIGREIERMAVCFAAE